MLRALGVEAVALREEHPENISDVELFRGFAGRELVFITTDTRQATRRQEATALRECGVTAIFFGPFFPKMEQWDQAIWLVRKWPGIASFAESVTLGTCADVKQNGKLTPFLL
jgi:hypothetical protein